MLDKRTKCALRYFVKECSEGSYKILETEEIISNLPKKFKPDEQMVAQVIKYLENGEYISVKYSDNKQYCLCPLPFGRQVVENIDQEEKNKKSEKHLALKSGVLNLVCGLIGAFLGTLIYYLV